MSQLKVKLNLTKIFIDTCQFKKNSVTSDTDGQPDAIASVDVDVPQTCKILAETRKSREYKGEKKADTSYYTLFVMPLPTAVVITEQLWVVVNGIRYNIVHAPPPVCSGAPYELLLELVRP